ncbi:MAG: transglutaminase-like cysteine peptidase [Rhizobiales bacterium]|nr:transglutaminase-like cysteine peptidase [Hyphomicrobiales bacterium]
MFATSAGLTAIAASTASGSSGKEAFGAVHGKSTPPVGYVRFCAKNPGECVKTGERPSRIVMTPDRWNLVYQVNTYVNGKIAPVSDQDLYGEPEFWALPVDAGDCEDYLLLKKRYLEGLGFPSSALLITVVLDEKNEGHALLTVAAEDGDYVLDNRRNEVLRWDASGYRFLKRQSAENPTQWVALTTKTPKASGYVAGAEKKK